MTVVTPIRAALNDLAHMCDNLGAIHGDYVRSALEAWDKLYKVEAENKRLREALRFYASFADALPHENITPLMVDRGNKARAALKDGE